MPARPPMPQGPHSSKNSSFADDKKHLLSHHAATSSDADNTVRRAAVLPLSTGAGADTAVGGDMGTGPVETPPPASMLHVRFAAGQAVSGGAARDVVQGTIVTGASGDGVSGNEEHAAATVASTVEAVAVEASRKSGGARGVSTSGQKGTSESLRNKIARVRSGTGAV